jgi:lipid-A-disaccharide synthase
LNKNKKIFICCTEQSGENIVFNICKKLKKYNYQIDGVCGKSSEIFFTNKYYDISLFKSLGLVEILFSLPKFIKIINILSNKILKNNYDLIICVDSPDFNYHLAKKIKKNNYRNQIIQIVAPTVWAWRSRRAKKFSKVFNEIFTLFNFERKFFENEGLKSTFIGHPISIIDESDYNNNQKKNLIAFLPGSRDNEINKLFPYLEYLYEYLLVNNITAYKIFIPTLPHLIEKLSDLTKKWKIETIISVDNENNEKLYKEVFISVTCSGTASLEISKRMIPQIVFYKLNFLTYFIFSFLVNIRFANILNILSNKMIIKEVVNRNLNKKNLLGAFDILLNDQNFRDKQISEVRKYLPEIQDKNNPYEICEKRITEIISTTI